MNYRTSYEPRNGFLLVRVSGAYDPVDAREVLTETRERAAQGKYTRILLDATGVSAPTTEIDRYSMGEAFATLLPRPFKVAVLFLAAGDKFAENTAVLLGADLLVCSTEEQALRWLLAT